MDLYLYSRAIELQSSVRNTNWVLMPGVLHVCFAALHGVGKTIESSGVDTIGIETGIYSAATIRGIYNGKQYKRGVEYHIMHALVSKV